MFNKKGQVMINHNKGQIMEPNKAAIINIVISVIFAIAMIVSSLFLNNSQYSEYKQTVTFFLITLWFIPFSYLSKVSYQKRKRM